MRHPAMTNRNIELEKILGTENVKNLLARGWNATVTYQGVARMVRAVDLEWRIPNCDFPLGFRVNNSFSVSYECNDANFQQEYMAFWGSKPAPSIPLQLMEELEAVTRFDFEPEDLPRMILRIEKLQKNAGDDVWDMCIKTDLTLSEFLRAYKLQLASTP